MKPRFGPVMISEKGHNRYCGPAALSILTGIGTAEAAKHLREHSGQRAAKGVGRETMRSVLYYKFGIHLWSHDVPQPRYTLLRWVRENGPRWPRRVYLVVAGTHYVVTRGLSACDNCSGQPMHIKHFAGNRARVRYVYEVIERS